MQGIPCIKKREEGDYELNTYSVPGLMPVLYCLLYLLHLILALTHAPFVNTLFFFCHTLRHAASWFPDQGLNLCPAVEAQSLNHWTTRKVPLFCTLLSLLFLCGLKICRQSLVFKNDFNSYFMKHHISQMSISMWNQ